MVQPSGTVDIRLTPTTPGRTTIYISKNDYGQARFRNVAAHDLWYFFYYFTSDVEIHVTHDAYPDIKTRDDVLDLFGSPGGAPDGDHDTFEALSFLSGDNVSGLTFDEAYAVFEREGPENPLRGQTAETFKPWPVTKVNLGRLDD